MMQMEIRLRRWRSTSYLTRGRRSDKQRLARHKYFSIACDMLLCGNDFFEIFACHQWIETVSCVSLSLLDNEKSLKAVFHFNMEEMCEWFYGFLTYVCCWLCYCRLIRFMLYWICFPGTILKGDNSRGRMLLIKNKILYELLNLI